MLFLNLYEKILSEFEDEDLLIRETELKSSAEGLYQDGVIAINKKIETNKQKACVLAEEIGHHKKTYGNIQKLDTIENLKQEYKARLYAYEKLVSLNDLAFYLNKGITNIYELADMLNVTDKFLQDALLTYKNKYGDKIINTKYGKIVFEPNIIFMPSIRLEKENE